jgi:hypothetical protein
MSLNLSDGEILHFVQNDTQMNAPGTGPGAKREVGASSALGGLLARTFSIDSSAAPLRGKLGMTSPKYCGRTSLGGGWMASIDFSE